MCGILGVLSNSQTNTTKNTFEESLNLLKHRGPDSNGIAYFDILGTSLTLGHTRLSIIDLSNGGNQPMRSNNGRYFIIYNGEIYNYKELRKTLLNLGYNFHSDSDTEVLLASWDQWGEDCLSKLRGMFAFSILDIEKKILTCVRDAFGIKPFYYYFKNQSFYFSSEIPALLSLIPHKPNINKQIALDYLLHGWYDHSSQTFYENIQYLSPGHILTIDFNIVAKDLCNTRNYFCLNPILPKRWWWPPIEERTDLNFKQATECLREMFLENVRLHLRSDVKIGAALSGGLDSSALVCAIRYIEPKMPINTFSYIARGSSVNEEKWADLVNNYINAVSHKIEVSPNDFEHDMEDMILTQGEPFGSTSIYAQYRVFKHAKKEGITVILDGQGADELLAGYHGYPYARIQTLIDEENYLSLLRFSLAWSKWPDRTLQQSMRMTILRLLPNRILDLLKKMSEYDIPEWLDKSEAKRINLKIYPDLLENRNSKGRNLSAELRNALTGEGLNALLRHADRSAMHFSIENRVPFLTQDIAEYLLSMPENFLISDKGETKYLFKNAMKGIVPDAILQRKDKIGFSTPENVWLLKLKNINYDGLARQLSFIKESSLSKENFFNDKWKFINYSIWLNQNNFN
jgi:asparagine synthase (glutamine-hydrolysing)